MTRYFEDLPAGFQVELGSRAVTAEEIITFGTAWDPQVFHTDPVAAAETQFGSLVASGVHTLGIFMRLYVDGLLADAASLGSPGLDEVRWPAPVRPGDVLSASYSVFSARTSATRPGWGIVHGTGELSSQRGVLVMRTSLVNMFARAPGDQPDGQG